MNSEVLHVVSVTKTAFYESGEDIKLYFTGYADDANGGPEWDLSLAKAHLFDNDIKDAQKIVDDVAVRFKKQLEKMDIFIEAISKKDIMIAKLKGS